MENINNNNFDNDSYESVSDEEREVNRAIDGHFMEAKVNAIEESVNLMSKTAMDFVVENHNIQKSLKLINSQIGQLSEFVNYATRGKMNLSDFPENNPSGASMEEEKEKGESMTKIDKGTTVDEILNQLNAMQGQTAQQPQEQQPQQPQQDMSM